MNDYQRGLLDGLKRGEDAADSEAARLRSFESAEGNKQAEGATLAASRIRAEAEKNAGNPRIPETEGMEMSETEKLLREAKDYADHKQGCPFKWGGACECGLQEFYNNIDAHLAKRDVVEVPVEFIRGFNTLAHNYSLKAEPPDNYFVSAEDAFADAYRRCGADLAKLAAMLRAAQEGK